MTTTPAYANIPEWTLGDRIRKIRVQEGYTQDEFAAHIGAKSSSLKQWETDRSRPRDLVAIANRIQMLTGVPATWVLDIENPPDPNGPGGIRKCATRDSNPQPSDPKVLEFPQTPNLPRVA